MSDDSHAVISYIGGSSYESSEAIIDCVSRGDKFTKAILLCCPVDQQGNRTHGFFLQFETLGWFVVSSGYSSGYGGTGPTQLSAILAIINRIAECCFGIEIDEDTSVRLAKHQLQSGDINKWSETSEIRDLIVNVHDYIFQQHYIEARNFEALQRYKPRLPLSHLHPKLSEIGLDIFNDPVGTLREVCSILESTLKEISDSKESSTKLFDIALKPRDGKLRLRNSENHGEQSGLQMLAKGFYQLHRNPIMHKSKKELDSKSIKSAISELLVANHILIQFSDLIKNPEYTEKESEAPK